MKNGSLKLRAKRCHPDRGEAELELGWPINLGLTVASHGWVHLEPWRWAPEIGTLSHAERIGARIGTIALRQRDPTTLTVSWTGFSGRAEAQILRLNRPIQVATPSAMIFYGSPESQTR